MSSTRPRLPSLNALRAFEVAARKETLRQAADELHVTHGAVSRQIRLLEEEFGEPLFAQEGRGRALTPRGRELAERLHDVFTDLTQAIEDFHRDGGTARPLSVSCEPTLCLKMLIRSLGALKAQTGLEVKVFAAGGPVEFEGDGIDLAVRRSDFAIDANLDVFPLAEEAVGPVVSPALLQGDPIEILRRVPQLHSMTRPQAWQNWFQNAGIRAPKGRREVFEHFYLALEAAQAGRGVAMASVYMAAGDIDAGLLIAPRRFVRDGTRYVCLSPVPIAQDQRRHAFASWLSRYMQELAEPFIIGVD
jgi:LysR family glycine cleavage system transcriptional activator